MSRFGYLLVAGGVGLAAAPGCGGADADESPFSGSPGAAGSGGGGGTAEGGAGGQAPSGSGGDEPHGGGGAEGNVAGSSGGGDEGGSPGGGHGGSVAAHGGHGGSDMPDVSWFCNPSVSSCVCVQDEFASSECGAFDCCYTYEDPVSGLVCTCDDASEEACTAAVESDGGTRVDHCPP